MTNNESIGFTDDGWTDIRIDNPRKIAGQEIPGLITIISHRMIDGVLWSRGKYTIARKDICRAWGPKDSKHCLYHYVNNEPDVIYNGCIDFQPDLNHPTGPKLKIKTPLAIHTYELTD